MTDLHSVRRNKTSRLLRTSAVASLRLFFYTINQKSFSGTASSSPVKRDAPHRSVSASERAPRSPAFRGSPSPWERRSRGAAAAAGPYPLSAASGARCSKPDCALSRAASLRWMSGRLRGWGDSTRPLAAIHESLAGGGVGVITQAHAQTAYKKQKKKKSTHRGRMERSERERVNFPALHNF